MKNLSMLIALSFVVLFTACKKDEDTPTTPTTPSYNIKWKMDGTEYSSTITNATSTQNNLSFGGTATVNGKYTSVGLYIIEYTGVKTYSGSEGHNSILVGDGTEAYHSLKFSPITIKITEDNGTEFKGEFSGKLFLDADSTAKSVSLTEGSFFMKKP